jgi:DNA-binding NtrC family response regulator
MSADHSRPVLIVEDEEAVLAILAEWLREEHADVLTCSRFEDARRYLMDGTPAALVTDIRLGAFNGLQLAMALHDRQPDVPIVVISAFDDPTLAKEVERLRAVFRLKPLRREDLLSALREATARAAKP